MAISTQNEASTGNFIALNQTTRIFWEETRTLLEEIRQTTLLQYSSHFPYLEQFTLRLTV